MEHLPSNTSHGMHIRLEVVDDSAGLTNKVLEVLPVCPEAVQKQLIGFLPEVVQEEEHQVRCDNNAFLCFG